MGSWNTVCAQATPVFIITLCGFETCSSLPRHSAKRKEKREETKDLRGRRRFRGLRTLSYLEPPWSALS